MALSVPLPIWGFGFAVLTIASALTFVISFLMIWNGIGSTSLRRYKPAVHGSPSEGLARYQDKQLFDLIDENAPVTSKELRKIGGYAYHGRWQKTEGVKGFDTSVTRLQEQCYVLTSGFVFTRDKSGRLRGWGAAEYSTPERFFGNEFSDNVYARTPEESYQRLMAHMRALLPEVQEETIKKFIH